ncbi:MAG: hypothetical protein RXN79_02740 [Candidatus Nanopusillus sp.]
MSSENKSEKKGEEAVAAVERWLSEVVAPVRVAIVAALPRASPEERAVVLARALQFLPGPAIAGAPAPAPAAPAAAPVAGQAEAKEPAAPAPGVMEPLRPDAGNGDAALSRALEALEWRRSKNGHGEWVLVTTPSGEPAGPFAGPPLREFLERVRAAPAETGLVLGGYRYRLHEGKFLHRWPLKRA